VTRLHVPVAMRFGDLDAYGHLNNVQLLRLLEEARVQAFWAGGADAIGDGGSTAAILEGMPGSGTLTLIARQEAEYLAPVPYLRQPLDVQLWIGHLGGASMDVYYEVRSPVGVEPLTVYARASTTIVLVDAASGATRRMTEAERAAWEPYTDDPIAFRRR
jgi:acyl-CoA thioester hydrolase